MTGTGIHADASIRRVIVPGLVRFGGLPQRELALACGLADRGLDVAYIEGMPSMAAITRDLLRTLFRPQRVEQVDGMGKRPRRLTVHVPPTVPTFFRSSWTPVLDQRSFRRWFAREFRDVDWSTTALYVTMPFWWRRFVDRTHCPAARIVYDRYDALEVSARTARALEWLRASEEALLRDADMVTHSAWAMRAELLQVVDEDRLVWIPNAVAREWVDEAPPPAAGRDRNEVVYLGAMEPASFDAELVRDAAVALPGMHFTLVGPVSATARRHLAAVRNVHCTGALSPVRARALLHRATVGIIPFHRNAITDVVNPLKMYEYAACGLPIVAMRTAELERHAGTVTLAGDATEFIRLIRDEARDLDDARVERQTAFARGETWDHRTDQLLRLIAGEGRP